MNFLLPTATTKLIITTPTRELVGLNAGAFELGVQLRMGK
jgi:hypothetical protein